MWANQLLLSKTALLEALQQQVEKQQAMADLIKRIKPQDGCATRSATALTTAPQPSLGPRQDGLASQASLSMDRDFDYGKVSCHLKLSSCCERYSAGHGHADSQPHCWHAMGR